MFVFKSIIITTGISLFAQPNVYGNWARTLAFFKFARSNPKPSKKDTEKTYTEESAFDKWKQACQLIDFFDLKDVNHPNRKLVSAEFSLLHALEKQKRLGKNPQVVLIHTETLGGKAAVHLLERVFQSVFKAEVKTCPIADFDVDDPHRLRQSLGNFMDAVAYELEGHDKDYTCFAPVGGYKVMTSLGYLAGAYMGFPTAYLHEDGQIFHEIAAVPIQIKREDLSVVAPLMCYVDDQLPEWVSLSSDEQKQIKEYSYLFVWYEDCIGLSSFGYFLKKRPEYQDLFAPKIKLSAEAKPVANRNTNFVEHQLQELLKKLKDPQAYRNELQHEVRFDNLKGRCTFSLYKCHAKTLIFRAAYIWKKQSNTLFVNRIWTNHDVYEREAKQDIGFLDNPEQIKWYDWEPPKEERL